MNYSNHLSPLRRIAISVTAFTFGLTMLLPVTLADSAITPIGPIGPVGVTGPVGPTTAVGPTSTPGPTGPTGPTTTVGPVATTTPDTAPSVSTNSSNTNTGTNSANTNTNSASQQGSITNNNTADTTTNAGLELNTGNNSLTSNTNVGGLSTGDINGTVSVVNVSNSVFAPGSTAGVQTLTGGNGNIALTSPTNVVALPTSINQTTGANSTNDNTSSGMNALQVVTNNNATANNNVAIDANTGNNTLTNNTTIGDIMTGAINLGVNLINLMNLYLPNVQVNLDIWSILGNLTGNILLPSMTNANTGSSSNNSNLNNQIGSTDISVTQNANANNNAVYNTNTGGNTYGGNSSLGNLTTGGTSINGSTVTVANTASPEFYLVNVFGNWLNPSSTPGNVVVADQTNAGTGTNSSNGNFSTQSNLLQAAVTNNSLTNNNIVINANTGRNTLTNNTKTGNVSTGAISIASNIVNFLNSFGGNVKSFTLGIVNIFGNWKGGVGNNQSNPSGGGTSPVNTSPDLLARGAGAVLDPVDPAQNASTESQPVVSDTPSNEVVPSRTIKHESNATLALADSASKQIAIASPAVLGSSIAPTVLTSAGAASNVPLLLILGIAFVIILISWGITELPAIRKQFRS